MNFKEFAITLQKIRNIPLPAEESQFKMSPPFREKLIKLQGDNIKKAKQSAVMVLFYPNALNETCFMLILRKTYKGVHSAQVGFPGGKLETSETYKQAALRETQEEIGVNPSTITVLKKLTQVYIPPSNFYVQPFIGIVTTTPQFIKQDSEVEALLEIKLATFIDHKIVTTKPIITANNLKVNVPAYKLNNQIVWGATAMMLSEVKDLLNSVI